MKLPLSDPLTGVDGANNALTFDTDLMGKITIQGAGAGKIETIVAKPSGTRMRQIGSGF